MKKNNLSFYVLFISVMTFLTVFALISTKSYENLRQAIKTAQNNSLGKPIDLDLKTDVIDQIEKRQTYER